MLLLLLFTCAFATQLVPIINNNDTVKPLMANKIHFFPETSLNGNITLTSPIKLATMQPGCYHIKYNINTYCNFNNNMTYTSIIAFEDKKGVNSGMTFFGDKENFTSFNFDNYIRLKHKTNVVVYSGNGCNTPVTVEINNFQYRQLDCRDMPNCVCHLIPTKDKGTIIIVDITTVIFILVVFLLVLQFVQLF